MRRMGQEEGLVNKRVSFIRYPLFVIRAKGIEYFPQPKRLGERGGLISVEV
jgi:hypothetical protein